ncbi:hypothetical protein LY76DRAFT_326203 [Colletotrichum caudatum]|nr:hypothetical protein LY76DRAFT_326203 [Colletotrichum caudatum]
MLAAHSASGESSTPSALHSIARASDGCTQATVRYDTPPSPHRSSYLSVGNDDSIDSSYIVYGTAPHRYRCASSSHRARGCQRLSVNRHHPGFLFVGFFLVFFLRTRADGCGIQAQAHQTSSAQMCCQTSGNCISTVLHLAGWSSQDRRASQGAMAPGAELGIPLPILAGSHESVLVSSLVPDWERSE